ncbi:membrane-bound O-acyltransferase family MBOAT [Leptospira inadai serovar Lyme str. 10]|uniref:Membrane-bound O-acyltransferase family MBOAT n=2 Tax=Leptospira inadai serovar Lyme TaxID=293084 RepID=V6HE48_9LEPT|nr:MBOAT family O-acyltransferase [Leptospira inadai]EQA38272.1 membrane-bound O-acyltransferase family MBOAT [Leptospira inadai serovar Lyme str. 10]PNV74387.1 MBOAT family protein [Leptospira inadai serovar Lyme]
MLFNSIEFLIFLVIVFILYYAPFSSKYQIQIIIVSSFIFYSFGFPILVFLLFFSAAINTGTSYLITYGKESIRRKVAILGVLTNLGLLIFFKYSGLLAKTFFIDESSLGKFLISIPLPVGISFFTFQGISLLIDVYSQKYFSRQEVVERTFKNHLSNVVFFISFFPQLVAGPIVKAHDFLYQIDRKKFTSIRWEESFKAIIIGYFLKTVVADNLRQFTFWIQFPYFDTKSTFTLLSLLFGYSFQIFADFAGYSSIAIGISKLFGYDLKVNFLFPYISTSFKEFWKRWHISLSSFLMEYLYIPLGGNRKGSWRTYANLMLTMFIGGLWHGAAWSYALWGLVHGAALTIERALKMDSIRENCKICRASYGFMVFFFVTFAWIFFQLPDINDVTRLFQALLRNWSLPNSYDLIVSIFVYSSPVILYHVHYLMRRNGNQMFENFQFIAFGTMIFLIVVNRGFPGSFIYFQF